GEGLGEGAIEEFLGAPPDAAPDAYLAASPSARLPLGVPVLLVHGDADPRVPISQSRAYAEAARAAGDKVQLVEIGAADHMSMIDPDGPAREPVAKFLGGLGKTL
ncbi:MAG: prolyl oligopeptidase family serine peptidase, partial [Actinobacteria bacterium]|nr:prolyl oligopeptidase family serine peptidase [Actinomycetota bacterium]